MFENYGKEKKKDNTCRFKEESLNESLKKLFALRNNLIKEQITMIINKAGYPLLNKPLSITDDLVKKVFALPIDQ